MDINERTKLLIDDSKLRDSCVAVFGLGGVGSYAAEALVRAGIGKLIICDNDYVTASNINRQLLALHSSIGRTKVGVAIERYLDINPELEIHAFDDFILPGNIDYFFEKLMVRPDYVADCIDTVSGKLAIIQKCKESGIPVISGMGTGNKLHPERFRITDISKTSVCPLCKVMRRELRERGIGDVPVLFSEEEPIKNGDTAIGSISTVPSVAGLMIANHIILSITES
ncbi:MAG: tRNA threonylcarbamoyladenosine dehydratase [Lachnospiraceae bacterium]|nr:tRNA threonylcarbamoyladenosine dehydratase [Lachnospiraceae bacterium]